MKSRAVVLAGGRGTRLEPYTTVLPKPLMPVGDMPVLELLIRQLRQSGVQDITIAVGYLGSLIEAYFGDGSAFDVRIEYSHELEPRGTAGPLGLIANLTDPFLLLNGDLLTDLDFGAMVEAHRRSGAVATIGLFLREMRIDLGVIETDASNAVISYTEKPAFNYRASMGAYVFDARVLQHIPAGVRFDLPDLVRALIAAGERVNAYDHAGYWLDIGNRSDYERAQRDFESMRPALLGAPKPPPA